MLVCKRACVRMCVCVFTDCVLGFVLEVLRKIRLQSQTKVLNARLQHFTTLCTIGNAKCYWNLEMT